MQPEFDQVFRADALLLAVLDRAQVDGLFAVPPATFDVGQLLGPARCPRRSAGLEQRSRYLPSRLTSSLITYVGSLVGAADRLLTLGEEPGAHGGGALGLLGVVADDEPTSSSHIPRGRSTLL
jgi:hypothetical protein